MSATRLWLASLLLCACGQRTTQVPAAAPSPEERWPEYGLPLVGVHAGFPAEPRELILAQDNDGVEVRSAGLTLDDGDVNYLCMRVWVAGRDREADDKQLARMSAALGGAKARTTNQPVGEFRGVEFEGTESEKRVLGRVYSVGDGAVYSMVTAPAAKVDAALAWRFVRGCRFEMPWRVHASEEGNFTVSIPDAAIRVPPEAMGMEDTVGSVFVVGGLHETSYTAVFTLMEELGPEVTSDAVLDTLIDRIRDDTWRGVWIGKIEVDGMPGRDLWWNSEGSHLRWRLLLTPTHLIQVGVSSASKDVVRSESSKAFIESLRVGAAD